MSELYSVFDCLKGFIGNPLEESIMELRDITIGECLNERADKTPSGVFIKHEDAIFTWKCVNDITNKVAMVFMDHGIRQGDCVGIYGVNSVSWVMTFLALQKIGATTVLINSHYKEKELLDCIEIADIKFLFHGRSNEGDAYEPVLGKVRDKKPGLEFLAMERSSHEWAAIADLEGMPNLPVIDSKDLACILFTSGTTSICKGVKLSHYSIVNNAMETASEMHWSSEDSICLSVPLFHCFGITVSLVASIVSGMAIFVLDRYRSLNVCQAIEKHRLTVLNGVPSMFLALVKNPEAKKYDLSSLRSGIIAGSPIFKEDYLEICSHLKDMKLQPSYGLTETSPCVTIARYGDSKELKSVSAGKVIDHVEIKIVNNKSLCQAGEIGEIHVKGYNVMQGYITKSSEVCNALQPDGWLRTGDLGYLDEKGHLYIVGRRKNLIIRGGENVSPREIEACIKEAESGIHTVVFGMESEVLQEEIVACIEGREDPELEEKIRAYLAANLSKYKVPKYIVFLEEFPKNATGKINEKKLKELATGILKEISSK